MNELQQKMADFLDDTVAYYSADPEGRRSVDPKWRSVGTPRCRYAPAVPTSEGCAIGRHMTPEQQAAGAIGPVYSLPAYLLPEKLKEMPTRFLTAVQNLHDEDDNWRDSGGMTMKGHSATSEIRERFELEAK